jgi:hypothetical protein
MGAMRKLVFDLVPPFLMRPAQRALAIILI